MLLERLGGDGLTVHGTVLDIEAQRDVHTRLDRQLTGPGRKTLELEDHAIFLACELSTNADPHPAAGARIGQESPDCAGTRLQRNEILPIERRDESICVDPGAYALGQDPAFGRDLRMQICAE